MSETAAIGFIGGRMERRRDGTRSKIWTCTAMFPVPPRYLYQSVHPEAVELTWWDDGVDCIGLYRCPHCGREFKAVIPR